jgi:ectoine hydroxylase-related dioxygenase (phytanoyl-CoA dioxygenase family)
MRWTGTLRADGQKWWQIGLAKAWAKWDGRRAREQFRRDGFAYLPHFFDGATCDRIAAEAEQFYARQGAGSDRADRTMNFHQESPAARRVLQDRPLHDLLQGLLGARPVFLQSIYFHRGSEQNPHSDYIYMSTRPDFHLCGFWMACEDIDEGAGPLVYYPGSHRLPIQNVQDRYRDRIDAVRAALREDEARLRSFYQKRMDQTKESLLTCYFFDQWLEEIHAALPKARLPRQTLQAKKGDVLIWHANLVHGGSSVADRGRTRKSLVAHYLTEAVVEYFDMNYVDRQNRLTLESIDHARPAVLQVRG